MNADDPNVELIEIVASHLGSMVKKLVFIGGSATGLLITDGSRPPVRATIDVDLLVETATRSDYYRLAAQLRKAGFRESRDVICRWVVDGIQVDVMPTASAILGFANRWAPHAVDTSTSALLPSGRTIRLITPPCFIATKIEAMYGRGGGNFRESHDLEDIVNLVDGRPELLGEIADADSELRHYLREEIGDLLGEPGFVDSLTWHFPGDRVSQARVPDLIARLRRIAGL